MIPHLPQSYWIGLALSVLFSLVIVALCLRKRESRAFEMLLGFGIGMAVFAVISALFPGIGR